MSPVFTKKKLEVLYPLIHVALLKEAWPLILKLGLKQQETRPFKVFRSKNVTLIVSGMGKEKTREALGWILGKEKFCAALNVGTAACSDSSVELGSVFSVLSITELKITDLGNEKKLCKCKLLHFDLFGSFLRQLPLWTVEQALCSKDKELWNKGSLLLADMEGSAFLAETSRYLPMDCISLVKIVSDHGSDKIPSKEKTMQLMEMNLDHWLQRVLSTVQSAVFMKSDILAKSSTFKPLNEK